LLDFGILIRHNSSVNHNRNGCWSAEQGCGNLAELPKQRLNDPKSGYPRKSKWH